MAENWLRYDRMVEQALRGVVRRALEEAEKRGLPGDHHFYVTFHTGRPGVGLADWLRQQYPQEMTIVLQHQFWDLKFDPVASTISVGLSFGGVPASMVIPLGAVTAFVDPYVRYGLRFTPVPAGEAPPEEPEAESPPQLEQPGETPQVVSLDAFRRRTPSKE